MKINKKLLTTAAAATIAAALFTACQDPNVVLDNTTAQVKVSELPKSGATNSINESNLNQAKASFAKSGIENITSDLFSSVLRSVEDQMAQDISRSIQKKTSNTEVSAILSPSYYTSTNGIITINEEDVNLDSTEATLEKLGFKGVGLSLARLYVYTDLFEDDPDNTKTDYTAEARVEASASYTAEDASKTILDAAKAEAYCNAKANFKRNRQTNEWLVSGKGRASAAAGVTVSDDNYGGRLVCNVAVTYDVNKVKITGTVDEDDLLDMISTAKASLIWYDDKGKATYTVFEAKNADEFKANYNKFYAQSQSSICVIPGATAVEATVNATISSASSSSGSTSSTTDLNSLIDFFDELF